MHRQQRTVVIIPYRRLAEDFRIAPDVKRFSMREKSIELRNSGAVSCEGGRRVCNSPCGSPASHSHLAEIASSVRKHQSPQYKHIRQHEPGFNRPRQCMALHATLSRFVKGGSVRRATSKRREEGLRLVSIQRIASR
jgi:hypothetical protein